MYETGKILPLITGITSVIISILGKRYTNLLFRDNLIPEEVALDLIRISNICFMMGIICIIIVFIKEFLK